MSGLAVAVFYQWIVSAWAAGKWTIITDFRKIELKKQAEACFYFEKFGRTNRCWMLDKTKETNFFYPVSRGQHPVSAQSLHHNMLKPWPRPDFTARELYLGHPLIWPWSKLIMIISHQGGLDINPPQTVSYGTKNYNICHNQYLPQMSWDTIYCIVCHLAQI